TTTAIRPAGSGGWMAYFGAACASCPLAAQCTSSRAGRTISIGPHEQQLSRARTAQQDPDWQADYRATRPKVERKIGHLMRRRHGGRRARVRGHSKIAADFSLLAAAVNLARLGVLNTFSNRSAGWAVATT
ncbi:MAG: transposase, partial [Actinomycetota bacterium]|nr:transposase [Actinomycetota bacterium]